MTQFFTSQMPFNNLNWKVASKYFLSTKKICGSFGELSGPFSFKRKILTDVCVHVSSPNLEQRDVKEIEI
jgi:hypothetical protein